MMILEKLKDIVFVCDELDIYDITTEEITPETTICSLYLDSLNMIELVMKIEDEFDIGLDDEDLIKICDIGDLIKIIEEKTCNLSEGSL